MKRIFSAILLCLLSQILFAQSDPTEVPKAVLMDEFGKICSEDLMARIDRLHAELSNYPDAKTHIHFYGDQNAEGRNLYYIAWMTRWYPTTRRFEGSKFHLVRGENRDHMRVQFWIVPAGSQLPKIDKEFTPPPAIIENTLYDRNWADFNNGIEGKEPLRIYSNGFFELGCEFAPNIGGFAKTLLENPRVNGHLVLYTAAGKGSKRGKAVGRFAVNELVKEYKIPGNRLTMVYGGQRKEPEIELWLVPKGNKLPVPEPDNRPK